ncbi:DUF3630 family protein [Colwellia sp. E2M01]|uniref:DUF3630 family protein n=1 Tax=Colwellia sp. E2M01 TaxID=2841561 RepID=UPI001C0A6612|nr:DUF3630 family protein [Colwellia sp. E2M01]MBU2871210.1 DUF3630 family protein [Colwellia sp. E2M01]
MQQHEVKQNIREITYQPEYLTLIFAHQWYQEDIKLLSELVFSPIQPIVIQEHNVGADREDTRFSWNDNYFLLNFDFYSQSCWIESQDATSTTYLQSLYEVIENAKNIN